MPIQTTILTQNLELPVRFACLWTGTRTQNPHRHTRKTSRIHTRWPGNGTLSLLACLSAFCAGWRLNYCVLFEKYNFVFGLQWSTSTGPNEQLHQDPECFPRLPEEPASFLWRKSPVVVCTVWPVALKKKHLQGEKNIFLLFSVHNQALYTLHQIDVTFLWKWEMSGVAQKLETLTLSPDTFGRGPGALLTLSVWILSPRRRALHLNGWRNKKILYNNSLVLFKTPKHFSSKLG